MAPRGFARPSSSMRQGDDEPRRTINDSENIKMLNSFISNNRSAVSAPTQEPHRFTIPVKYQEEINYCIRNLRPQTSTPTPARKRAGLAVDNYSPLKELKIIYVWKHHWKNESHTSTNPTHLITIPWNKPADHIKTERHERGHVVTAGSEASLLNWHLNERTPERPRRMII